MGAGRRLWFFLLASFRHHSNGGVATNFPDSFHQFGRVFHALLRLQHGYGAVRGAQFERDLARPRRSRKQILQTVESVLAQRLYFESNAKFAGDGALRHFFEPERFLQSGPDTFAWIPFGGGVNRCVGAGFAAMEMDVALRTLLREFRFAPTDAPGERRQNHGVSIAPARGARAVVYRRTAAASGDRVSVSVADHGS